MREIKFRAWNHDLKRMSDPFTLLDYLGWYVDEEPCYDLMQFTGLKDKNGTEIYEGDIVEHNSGNIYPIKYNIGELDGDGEEWTGYSLGKESCKEIEVIGNIYENPELLTPTH